MTTTTITGQRVRVIPVDVGRDYVGLSTATPVDAFDVALTSAALRALGGEALVYGKTWRVYLDLLYLSSTGAATAQAITTADPSGTLLTVYDPSTRAVVATRQLNAAIPGLESGYELKLAGSGSPGRVIVTWHDSEDDADFPGPGLYDWSLEIMVNHEATLVASGILEVLAATPAVTA